MPRELCIAQGFDRLSSNFHDHGLIEQWFVEPMIMENTIDEDRILAL